VRHLLFEAKDHAAVRDPVNGPRFGELLRECGVPIAVLNACRSARSELGAAPSVDLEIGARRSFESLAEELVKVGVFAVVAMRYNIYVDTAAQFVASLYSELAKGSPLSDAITHARRALFENPSRTSVFCSRNLQDWTVPVLFQARRVVLAVGSGEATEAAIGLSSLPAPPSTGFIGRDDPLLELDRNFQSAEVILLWGSVGSGKTATAVAFGRWLGQTGGAGAVLFT
jgi:hypothetical protein